MSRLIDAERLDCVSWKDIPDGYKDIFVDGVQWILEQIDAQPTVEERKTGKWICESIWSDIKNCFWHLWGCDQCGYIRQAGWEDDDNGMKPIACYCENCGARLI